MSLIKEVKDYNGEELHLDNVSSINEKQKPLVCKNCRATVKFVAPARRRKYFALIQGQQHDADCSYVLDSLNKKLDKIIGYKNSIVLSRHVNDVLTSIISNRNSVKPTDEQISDIEAVDDEHNNQVILAHGANTNEVSFPRKRMSLIRKDLHNEFRFITWAILKNENVKNVNQKGDFYNFAIEYDGKFISLGIKKHNGTKEIINILQNMEKDNEYVFVLPIKVSKHASASPIKEENWSGFRSHITLSNNKGIYKQL